MKASAVAGPLVRRGLAAVFLLGALLSLFGIGTAKMLAMAAALGAGAWFLRGKCGWLEPAVAWMRRHPAWALGVVLALGLALRTAFFFGHLHGDPFPFQPGDGKIFYAEALEMASGSFPETKSWVTVGSYALSIRLFGESCVPPCVLNVLLQTACAVLLWMLGRRLFGEVAAVLASLAYFVSPLFVGAAFQLYSEHFFFPLVLLLYLLLDRWLARHGILCAAAMAAVVLLAFWTKPDAGILSLASAAFVFACDALLRKDGRWRVPASAIVALAVVACGFCGARWVNRTWHGTSTFLCSEDGAWPRYFGANRETGGKAKMDDKLAVYETYRRETGIELEFRQNHCPPELVPLIRDEIRRRWASMTFADKVQHVFAKEAYSWQITWTPLPGTVPAKLHAVFKVAVWLAAGWTLLALARRMRTVACPAPADLLRALPVLYLLGMSACIVLVEANMRYSWSANVFLPLYFGAAFRHAAGGGEEME